LRVRPRQARPSAPARLAPRARRPDARRPLGRHGKNIELWDKARFAALNQATLGDDVAREEMAKRLAELGL